VEEAGDNTFASDLVDQSTSMLWIYFENLLHGFRKLCGCEWRIFDQGYAVKLTSCSALFMLRYFEIDAMASVAIARWLFLDLLKEVAMNQGRRKHARRKFCLLFTLTVSVSRDR
jgi:hypothetical protein